MNIFNANPDTNHNANPTKPSGNRSDNPNHINLTNPTTKYRCEFVTCFCIFTPMATGTAT